MKLKGKTIACFIALPHHTRFLLPVAESVRKRGAKVIFFLSMSDYPFERELIRGKQDFKYLTDYLDKETKEKIDRNLSKLLDRWTDHCFNWDGFRHWSLFEQSRFFNALLEEYFCLERFIEKESPDLFLALHERNRWGKLTGHLAGKHALPYITLQEGDYHEERLSFSAHTEYSTADLLWGEATKEMLLSHKCSGDKMILVGNTHLDQALKKYAQPYWKKRVKKELKLPENKKILLVLIDLEWGAVISKEIWQNFLDGLSRDIICIFKWHPNVVYGTFKKIEENIKEIAPSCIILHTYDAYSLLGISDYCVTLGKTTLALEALTFGKPLFSIPSRDGNKDYYVKMGVAQTVAPLGNWSNLHQTIQKGLPPEIERNVKLYLQNSFLTLDGKSVERTVNVLEYILTTQNSETKDKYIFKNHVVKGRVSFIIPSGDNQEALLATLTSLSQNVKYPDWEVIIVVNDQGIKSLLAGISGDVRTIEVKDKRLSHLYNKGAEIAAGEYLVFMKPGILYFKGEKMIKAMKQSIAGIPLRNPDQTPYCLGISFDFNFTPYKIRNESRNRNPKLQTTDVVGGGLIGIYRDLFETLGGFDQELADHLIETDLCLTARDKGFPINYLPDCLAFVYQETFRTENDNWKGRIRFFAKWTGNLPKDEDYLNFASELLKL